jgi:hypothetical protein
MYSPKTRVYLISKNKMTSSFKLMLRKKLKSKQSARDKRKSLQQGLKSPNLPPRTKNS